MKKIFYLIFSNNKKDKKENSIEEYTLHLIEKNNKLLEKY